MGSQVYSFGRETKFWSQLSGFGHTRRAVVTFEDEICKFLSGIEGSGHLALWLVLWLLCFPLFALKPFCSASGWTQPNCLLLPIVID